MAEAPEHVFLSQTFLMVLQEFSGLSLYSYAEADRKRFDFACNIVRDWDRKLVGQTLWKHQEGIDKDIRTLLTASDASIWAYVARDTVKNRSIFSEAVNDFRTTGFSNDLHRLRVFWVPGDFSASNDEARTAVQQSLREDIVHDILFNIIFGNLTGDDIRCFMIAPRTAGQNLGVLYSIAHSPDTASIEDDIAVNLRIRKADIGQSIYSLLGSGFLWQEGVFGRLRISLKGRVLLSLLSRIYAESSANGEEGLSTELKFILGKLDLDPDEDAAGYKLALEDLANFSPTTDSFTEILTRFGKWSPRMWLGQLYNIIYRAIDNWGMDLSDLQFDVSPDEDSRGLRIMR